MDRTVLRFCIQKVRRYSRCLFLLFQICFYAFLHLFNSLRTLLQGRCHDSAVGVVAARVWKTEDSMFEAHQEKDIFLFSIASRLTLGLNKPFVQEVLKALSWRLKRPGHEADQLIPPIFEVKNEWRCICTLCVCLHDVRKGNSISCSVRIHLVEDYNLRQAISHVTFSFECGCTNVIITLFSWLSV
jgi:hypothetical protein